MTLELAKKRRDQSDLIRELAEVLEKAQRGLHKYRTKVFARGQYVEPFERCRVQDCVTARAVLEKAKLLDDCTRGEGVDLHGRNCRCFDDCIPIDDVREVHG